MAIEKINIEQFLELAKDHHVVDVRSPGEYKHAHIPGAYSLPLFTDEERAAVGTAYKQESREKAIKIGLDYFGPKMRKMVEEVEGIGNKKLVIRATTNNPQFPIPSSKLLLVYCWRGGMRSSAVAWLLDLYGFKIYTLIGGYKKFRNHVLETFKFPFPLRIIGGYTGSGKTEVLKELERKGERVVDLENIANHKGSAFGNIGLPKQPTQEMFENVLSCELRVVGYEQMKDSNNNSPIMGSGYIWMEDESQRIGLVNIPNDLWNNMRRSPVYFLDIPFEERLKHITEEYGNLDKERMSEAILRISQRLGGLETKNAIQYLREENITDCFRILLTYYDRWYLRALHNRENVNSLLNKVKCGSVNPLNAKLLIQQPEYYENL